MDKEYVFEFSGNIPMTDRIQILLSRIVIALGGKKFYIENGNKLVVVM